jgi:phosphate regulon transcriptional regulator PhoB
MKVLVVDDEQPIVDAVAYNLRKEGYEIFTAGNAEQCLVIARRESPDLVLLDVMLPSATGFDVCRLLRKQSNVPIIMLTAKAEETDRIVGLELGADDYITKPFSMRELLARVKSVLRRSGFGSPERPDEVVNTQGIKIDPLRHEVTVDQNAISLSPKEFDLLYFMARNPGHVFSRQLLLDNVWGIDAYVEDRTVDVHIRWLREKVERDPSQPERLLTVRGVGYKLAGD